MLRVMVSVISIKEKKMSHQEDFAKLEAIVERLLQTVDELRRQNSELQGALSDKEGELRVMREEAGSLHEERKDILSRVTKLVDSIESWENEQRSASPGSEGTERQTAFSPTE
jgi:peptidoglycan hydrolase CwlO-like protein